MILPPSNTRRYMPSFCADVYVNNECLISNLAPSFYPYTPTPAHTLDYTPTETIIHMPIYLCKPSVRIIPTYTLVNLSRLV